MNRAITTTSTKAQLQEYHQELQYRERQERKDKCILFTLAVAGIVGVYALVYNGVKQNNLSDRPFMEVQQEDKPSPNRTAVSSLR